MAYSRSLIQHGKTLLQLGKIGQGGLPVLIPVRHLPLAVGYRAEKKQTFSQTDVEKFADVSGDLNPIHFDASFAKTTMFRRPVVHGVLQLSVISSLIGTELPGAGTIALQYEIQHPHPLYLEEEMKAEVEIVEMDRRRITMKITCTAVQSNKVTTSGSIKILAPKEAVVYQGSEQVV